jgi:hypothetical protein
MVVLMIVLHTQCDAQQQIHLANAYKCKEPRSFVHLPDRRFAALPSLKVQRLRIDACIVLWTAREFGSRRRNDFKTASNMILTVAWNNGPLRTVDMILTYWTRQQVSLKAPYLRCPSRALAQPCRC